MSYAFVAIEEGMIEYEGETECGGFRREIGIQVYLIETVTWLSQGRGKDGEVSNAASSTPPFQDGLMQRDYFGDGEIARHERRR